MRFIDRALGALRYHRRAYLGELAVALLFCAASLVLLTCRTATTGMRDGFLNRLQQFDRQALAQADTVLGTVKTAYTTLDQRYLIAWWSLIGGLALLGLGFGLWFGHQRRSETAAYLMVGKSRTDIAAQYLLESVLVFVAAFVAVWLLAALLGTTLGAPVEKLAQTAFTHQLDQTLTSDAVVQDITKLMHARLTSFNGPGLLLPNTGPQPETTIIGGVRTAVAGLLAIIGGQGLGLSWSLTRQRRRLARGAVHPAY